MRVAGQQALWLTKWIGPEHMFVENSLTRTMLIFLRRLEPEM